MLWSGWIIVLYTEVAFAGNGGTLSGLGWLAQSPLSASTPQRAQDDRELSVCMPTPALTDEKTSTVTPQRQAGRQAGKRERTDDRG